MVFPFHINKVNDDDPAKVPQPKGVDVYEVVLGTYQTEQSAQSELKALQILGFNVKDARINMLPGEGYKLSLARLNSRKSADDLAAITATIPAAPGDRLVIRDTRSLYPVTVEFTVQ